ncbi:uncharacterized protein LOC100114735 isoform X2 [Nasonia vitripennis]|uniref:Uncharacterized protein n=1 Tax=Nasonia vitripennis TaxID=7425 RepID=A0A7M7QAP5_NASVI|nr:uncharacterized protein LOC100114735 isoform X2 [Nasonia vitripennis]
MLRQSLLGGLLLVLLLFAPAAEGIFFQFPKRAVMNFLESLGGKKQPPPIHHIHRHYYPVPLTVLLPKPAPPPKIEIDLTSLHSGHDSLRSLGWSSQDYGKIYEPEIVIPSETPWASAHSEAPWVSPLPEAWPDTTGRKSWGWENNEILGSIAPANCLIPTAGQRQQVHFVINLA